MKKTHLIKDAGPADFVGLIKSASYIVTDSFHGTLFSINYNKVFFAFSKKEGGESNVDNVRIREFLSQIDLSDRFNSDKLKDNIDYTRPNLIVDNLRKKSYQYLLQIITEVYE